ncbi:LysE family translocator [Corynebacterium sp. J010B-136]|uniref:LysE family translocator n=1 Tax=Corynebacterium sp. J010B-136 TaxID=2099401 RepID=UPI000CF9BABE|nr:LysE family transporter [Corynebacterium sp. J010B-136]PQM74094.1 threonine transporter [Corynebacterium sp. J010B-136]
MAFASLLTLTGVWLAVCIAPGPDVVQVMRVASRSVRAGLWCTAGITAGIAVWLTASLAGMSALIATHPGLLGVLQLFGGLFLAWMGMQSVRSGVRARRAPSHIVATEDSPAAPVAEAEMPAHAFRLGLYTNLSNPKALVFFGAVFAQFIRPEMSIAWTFAVGIWLLALSTAWFVIVTFIVRGFSTWLAKYSPLIDVIAGVIFIILGAVMVYEGIIQLL